MTLYKRYAKAYAVLTNGLIDYEGDKPIERIYEKFLSEYGWQIERIGYHKALSEWLAGLALNIPYYYHDIIDTFGITEKQCENYFPFMAMRLNELFKSRGLETPSNY